jgi:hypothetical protein
MSRIGLKDRVLEIHRRNGDLTVSQIAEKIDASNEYVRATLRRAGCKASSEKSLFRLKVPTKVGRSFSSAAAARGMSIEQIVTNILTILSEEDMIDAVLDDKEDAA